MRAETAERKKARLYAARLLKEGHTEEQIGRRLHKEGIWSSKQSGKALKKSGVVSLLKARSWPSHNKDKAEEVEVKVRQKAKRTIQRNGYKKYREVISPVIRLTHLNDTEKVALLQLLDEKLS